MKDNLEVIECPENARVWELVWGICKLAIVLALVAGIATGVLLKTLY